MPRGPKPSTKRAAPKRPSARQVARSEQQEERERLRLYKREYDERLRKSGLVCRTYWATPSEHAVLYQTLHDLRNGSPDDGQIVAPSGAKPSPQGTPRPRPPYTEHNRAIYRKERVEVQRRIAAGETRDAIADWLADKHGFKGGGGALKVFI